MWGCTDQLLINKVVADEVRNHRRNLCTIWLDYKKAYDSVPFQWILEALRLAKVPEAIVESIQTLMKSWVVELNLPTKEGNIQIGEILYRKGLLQGDYLSVILFILSLNPVSYLLNQADVYKMGDSEKRDKNLTHLLFVDDMKLYANSRAKALYLLDIVTTFSRDIGMAFGEDKCGYIYIEKGKRKAVGKSMVSNDVTIKELKEGELYKYLGLDENIQYDGSINKGKILKEYFRRVKAIWSSELNSRNKTIAHNTFALPILVPTAGILQWTLQEIEEVDKKTRKLLCMSGNFHRNSDVDRLYVKRKDGGRGLKSFEDSFINRIIGLARHLERDRTKNHLLQNVYDHEQKRIIRLSKEYEGLYHQEEQEEGLERRDKSIIKRVVDEMNKEKKDKWQEKVQHGYLLRKTKNNEDLDLKKSNIWLVKGKFSSHIEGYLFAIQEQEIETRILKRIREKDPLKRKEMPRLCRMCGKAEEDIFHVIASCPYLSSNLYLHYRHNPVAKALYKEITAEVRYEGDADRKTTPSEPPNVTKIGDTEIWWDHAISTATKIPHNRPDVVIWNKENKTCQVIDICFPLDTNVQLRHGTKRDNYVPLIDQLRRIYPGYTYRIIPIIIGALGTIPRQLSDNLKEIGLSAEACKRFTEQGQKLALLGTLKITKNFQKH